MGAGFAVGLCIAAYKLAFIVIWTAIKLVCYAIAWIISLVWRALRWAFRRIVRGVKRSRAKREQGAKGSANPRSRQISCRTQVGDVLEPHLDYAENAEKPTSDKLCILTK